MAEVMMTLGDYQFGLDSAAFQELNRNTEWRWSAQDVFENRPVLQFTGKGEDSITLPGVIFPEYWGGTGQIDMLRALADDGEPQTLIDGRGNVMGEWVITGVQERQSVFAAAGVGRRQEFTISLKRFSDAGQAVLAPVAIVVAAGVGARTATQQAASAAQNAASKAAQSASALTSAATAVQGIVSSVVTPMRATLNAIGSAASAARSVQQAANTAQQAINILGSITNLSTTQAALGGLMRAASDATQSAAKASRAIDQTRGLMQTAGDSAGAIAIVKSAMIDVNRLAVSAASIRAQAETIVRKFS